MALIDTTLADLKTPFIANGNWRPSPGCLRIVVEGVGGGGGGAWGNPAGVGSCSGGAGCLKKQSNFISGPFLNPLTVTIGQGGPDNGSGTDTILSDGPTNLFFAAGAPGGGSARLPDASMTPGGAAGMPGTDSDLYPGGAAGIGAAPNVTGGGGGASSYGPGGNGADSNTAGYGAPATAYGAGGGGGSRTGQPGAFSGGGAGCNGVMYIYEYYT